MDNLKKIIRKEQISNEIKKLENAKKMYLHELNTIQKNCKHDIVVGITYKEKETPFTIEREHFTITCLFCEKTVSFPRKMLSKEEEKMIKNTSIIKLKLDNGGAKEKDQAIKYIQEIYIWIKQKNPQSSEQEIADKMIEHMKITQKYTLSYDHYE